MPISSRAAAHRQRVATDRGSARPRTRSTGVAGGLGSVLDRVERLRIVRRGRQARASAGVALVGDVVGAAREGVDRLDRAGRSAAGPTAGGHREVLVMVDRQGERTWREALQFSGLYRASGAACVACGGATFRVYGGFATTAKVAELVDALDLGSSAERHEGSSPSFRTKTSRGVVYPVCDTSAPSEARGMRFCPFAGTAAPMNSKQGSGITRMQSTWKRWERCSAG